MIHNFEASIGFLAHVRDLGTTVSPKPLVSLSVNLECDVPSLTVAHRHTVKPTPANPGKILELDIPCLIICKALFGRHLQSWIRPCIRDRDETLQLAADLSQ